MKRFLSRLMENLDTLVAIGIAILATFWGTFGSGENISRTLTAISGILGVLAIAIIRDRSSREGLLEEVDRLQQSISGLLSGTTIAENFFFCRPQLSPLAERFKGAQTIDLMGTALTSLALLHIGTLRELLDSGTTIRVIVSNPENVSQQEYLSMRFLETESAKIHAEQVRTSLSNLATLMRKGKNKNSFQVRITNHVQTFAYVGIDTSKASGRIQVELYLDKVPIDRNPMFSLRADKDPHWFEEYKHQFEHLWRNSIDVNPTQGFEKRTRNRTKQLRK